jgi:hypothetical protein
MLEYAQTRYNEEWSQIVLAEFINSASTTATCGDCAMF